LFTENRDAACNSTFSLWLRLGGAKNVSRWFVTISGKLQVVDMFARSEELTKDKVEVYRTRWARLADQSVAPLQQALPNPRDVVPVR
jgi:hypothetical protein